MGLTTEQFIKLFSMILTSIIGIILRKWSEKRPRLVLYVGHIAYFQLNNDENTIVNTHGIVIRNDGNKPSMNIRIGHYFLPDNINVSPPVKYVIEETPGGTKEIIFDILVPKEQITISYLYYKGMTWDKIHAYTKSDEGFAKIINAIPSEPPPLSAIIVGRTLMFLGASLIIYWVAVLIII